MIPSSLINDPGRAWAPFEPGPEAPWDRARVAHLHRRAGFAASWATLERDRRDGPGASVDRLLAGESHALDGTPAAEFDALMDGMGTTLSPGATLPRLQGIWLYRLIFTPHPLRERLTLFWHNHFATSYAKVGNSALMQRQNALFRTHALGDFGALLRAVSRDPAMLVWLDATASRKAHPNENYAREVMELFTLGRGQYTEPDIREAARAFTGRFVIGDDFRAIPAQHDDGPKTIFGRTGPFDGDDVLKLLLEQPACARFLCGKLVRQFVTEVDDVPPALIEPLARAFRESGHDVQVPVGIILRSNLFHAAEVRRRRVKNPVEFAVGTIRALEVLRPTVPAEALADACGRMGQNLYAPPSVAGWDGGPAWASSAALLARTNFALGLVGDAARCDPKALAARHGFTSGKEAASFVVDLLVQDAFAPDLRGRVVAGADAKQAATLVLAAPEYQLA